MKIDVANGFQRIAEFTEIVQDSEYTGAILLGKVCWTPPGRVFPGVSNFLSTRNFFQSGATIPAQATLLQWLSCLSGSANGKRSLAVHVSSTMG